MESRRLAREKEKREENIDKISKLSYNKKVRRCFRGKGIFFSAVDVKSLIPKLFIMF